MKVNIDAATTFRDVLSTMLVIFKKLKQNFTVCLLFILFQVAKQWYDFDRQTFNFVHKLKDDGSTMTFTHQHDFDENGLLYWIGTNGK